MNRHLPKTFVISLVSFVLIYYSTAWAVLRCVHEEGRSDHAVALADSRLGARLSNIAHNNVHANNAYRSSSSYPGTYIDCLNLAYHTESLGGPSSPPQLQRWMSYINPHPADFLSSLDVTEDWARDVWLRFVFERPPGLTFFLDSPLYLSLSIFRI